MTQEPCRLEVDDGLPGVMRFRCTPCHFAAWLILDNDEDEQLTDDEIEQMVQAIVDEHEAGR